jgi:hypothetical protein
MCFRQISWNGACDLGRIEFVGVAGILRVEAGLNYWDGTSGGIFFKASDGSALKCVASLWRAYVVIRDAV